MIRKAIILTKISEIEESVNLIDDNLPETFEEFQGLGLVRDGM